MDRVFAFDYDQSGKLEHLVLFLRQDLDPSKSTGRSTAVYQQRDPCLRVMTFDRLPTESLHSITMDSGEPIV
jgi:hypothetical protein